MAGAGRVASWTSSSVVYVPDHAVTISSSIVPQIQFIDSGWLFLLCGQRRVLTVQTVQPIVEIPGAALGPVPDMPVVQRGAQFACRGRRHLRRGADADSYGPSFQKNIEIPQLQYIDKVIDIWVCRSCSSSVLSWRRQLSSHSCADCMNCCCHARRCATTAALV